MAETVNPPKRGSQDAEAGDLEPPIGREEIVTGLRQLGLSPGDGVMVHSSLKSFGRVAGGAATVIQALMDVLTPSGTLLMPSFNHGAPFRKGGAGYYDPLATPTTNGAIPNTFWQMPGVYRTYHPTHAFAAWGRNARRYTAFHHRTLTLGPDSPLGLLGREGGHALLVGVDYRVNTYHHVVEMTTGAPCLGKRTVALPVKLPDGRTVHGRTWGWRGGTCPINEPARYARLMDERRLHRQIRIGASQVTLFTLRDCFEVIAEALANGLDGFPPCSRCRVRPRPNARRVESDWDDKNQCLLPDSEAWGY